MANAQRTLDLGEGLNSAKQRYQELRDRLRLIINDFADENDVSPGALALLLVDIGVASYMLEYMLTTEKPSSLGLKLELDRFRREIDDFIRSSKKTADEFVPRIKEFLADIESEAPATPSAA